MANQDNSAKPNSAKNVVVCISLMALIAQLFLPVFADDEIVAAENIIDLRLKKTLCITAGLHQPLRNRTSEQFLLAIDGESLRNYTFDQIKKKLRGPLGSSVKVEIGYPNGDTETLDVRREPYDARFLDSNADPIRELGNELYRMRVSSSNLLESGSSNADLIAKGRCIRAAEECKENGAIGVSPFLNCMLLSQAIGDFDAADHYLELALDSIKSSPPTSNIAFREKAVIQNLISLGKSNEAEAICKYLLLPEPSHMPRLPAAISVLDSYSLIPTKSAQNASRELAQSILSGKTPQVVTAFHQDYFWFGQYLESLGWNDKALDVCSKETEKLQKLLPGTGFYGPQALAYCLYSKARLEAFMGKKDLAEKDLEAIKRVYRDMSAKQQGLIDRIPEYFPTLTDVEKAQASLSKSTPIMAPPSTPSFSNQDPLVNECTPSFELQFPKARKCFSLIKENNMSDAIKVAQELVNVYQNSGAIRPYFPVRQNLFCTCLRIARAFADHGRYDLSDIQLTRLEAAMKMKVPKLPSSDISWSMISAERIYNAICAGSKPNWSLLHDAITEAGSKSSLPWPIKLDVLAMAYHHADEPKRAKVFIDQSFRDLNSPNQSEEVNAKSNNPAEEQAIHYIDAACIYAKLSDFKNSNNFLDHAFARQFKLNERLAAAFLDLATLLYDRGQTDKAISILEKAAATKPSKDVSGYGKAIDMKLADLYRKNGQPDRALSVIKTVIGNSKEPASKMENEMAAQLFEESKIYGEAAKYYYEAGKWRGRASEQQREQLLHKAIDCATKTEGCEKSVLSKAYLALCEIVGKRNLKESLILRQKAVSLLMDTDPDKPEQLSIIAYVKGELSKSNSTSPDGTMKSTQLDDKIASASEAAELAARNNSKDACVYWLRLADAEAEANRINLAVEHARKGIEAYQSANAKTHMLDQLLSSRLPSVIARAGSSSEAESLLKDAQARVESVAGPGSLPAQVQMAHYFDYLVLQQKDYAKAEKLLDSLLKTDLNKGSYSPPNHDVNICRFGGPYPVESSMEVISKLLAAAKQSVVGKENHQALRFLDKILAAETKQFGKDDYRVAITYAEIARIHSASGDNLKAYAAYKAAISVMHQYEDMLFVLSNINPDYYEVLRKLNLQSEIEKTEDQKLDEQKSRQSRLFRQRK